MAGGNRKVKTLTVHRKEYTRKDGTHVRGATFEIKDRGAPGRGKAVLPPVKRAGAMTKVAVQMGYERPTDIPYNKLDDYAEELVGEYGKKSAMGMLRRQLIYRKRMDGAKKKFQVIDEYVRVM